MLSLPLFSYSRRLLPQPVRTIFYFVFFLPYSSAGLPQRLVSPRVPLIHTYLSIQMSRSDDEARRQHLGINFSLRSTTINIPSRFE